MKKIFFLILFFILTAFNVADNTVYICGSAGAKKYHYKESCRGFNACKHEIIKTTKAKAEEIGLTLCGWED